MFFNFLVWKLNGTCEKIIPLCPNPYVSFWLYTKGSQFTPHKLEILKPETFEEAPFNTSHPTKILIHGYTGWKDVAPNNSIRPGKIYYV